MNRRPNKILLTGAQTGGHLVPAIVVGTALRRLGIDVTLVSSGQDIETKILSGVDIPVTTFTAPKLKGMGFARSARGVATLPLTLFRAVGLVRRERPRAVIGFGGYTSGPVVVAAALLGIPTAICEQNYVPGFTNRILARCVDLVMVAYEESKRWFPAKKTLVTGVPVREEILSIPEKCFTEGARNLLVFGGSQGSHFLNTKVPLVIGQMAKMGMTLRVLHQTGQGREEQVKRAYEENGVEADVRDYLHDMAAAYRLSDFVICRAGAGTVSEATAIGLPALFVPFAKAADNHQFFNARAVVEAGGAVMVEEKEFDCSRVAALLFEILRDKERLSAMARASRALGRRDALEKVVGAIVRLGELQISEKG